MAANDRTLPNLDRLLQQVTYLFERSKVNLGTKRGDRIYQDPVLLSLCKDLGAEVPGDDDSAIAPPPTVSPANVAPHLPPPTEIPLPGPAEPIQLAEKPSHAVSGGSSEEKELEAMVDEISAALTSLGMNEGERNPQAATEPVREPAGKGQLTLKDMKAAVWLPRLPKKRELEGTPNVAVLDNHGVLRPVANPHSKPAAPPIPHEPSEDRGLSSEENTLIDVSDDDSEDDDLATTSALRHKLEDMMMQLEESLDDVDVATVLYQQDLPLQAASAGDSATYVTESLPFGTDQLETQLVMPSEEFINTHEMKTMLAREDLAEVPQQEVLSVETSGEMVEAGHCKEVAPEENGQHPDVPSHPTVTRRAQFTVKQKIKEERAAVSWSVYWKTNGVGVLLNPEYIEGYEHAADQTKPVKKKDWKHTTHFGAGYCTQCNLILANKWVEKLWDNATEEWYLRPKHETMQQYDKPLMARKRKWTAALRRAVDESFFIGLPGLELEYCEFFAGAAKVFEEVKGAAYPSTAIDIEYMKNAAHEGRTNPFDFMTPCGFGIAVWLISQCRPKNFFILLATVCSSWIHINAGTSRRSMLLPEGRQDLPYIQLANGMASRTLWGHIHARLHGLGYHHEKGNPQNSYIYNF
ncbi:unnamed protein product [Cladocopium goreaui]|uniref:Uncharacterized protein n=1 Tax=Cladocopium goreaui TaxID=2562237 RepID=A0A9P1BZ34_9DINO|nr:unnamed protein product [Cladocopium goreaui]